MPPCLIPQNEFDIEGFRAQDQSVVEGRLDSQIDGFWGENLEGPQQLRHSQKEGVRCELFPWADPAPGAKGVGETSPFG